MYKISQFANMTGLTQSKVRFYEKYGLLKVHKEENGYRYFTRWDAFRVNAFRSLLEYGFTIKKAVQIIDKKQSGSMFINSLEKKQEELQIELNIMNSLMKKINKALSLLNSKPDNNFRIEFMEDYLYVLASNGIDFDISNENRTELKCFADVMPIASCARIIKKDELMGGSKSTNPSYCFALPVSEEHLLKKCDKRKIKRIELGKCVYYQRKVCRSKSQTIESYYDLFEYLDKYNLRIRGDVILFPTFLNLDEYGNDIEILYVPIEG